MFEYSNPISILGFLTTFPMASNSNGRYAREAICLFHFFMKNRPELPSTHVLVCPVQPAHVENINWCHTATSSNICRLPIQSKISCPRLMWTSGLSNGPGQCAIELAQSLWTKTVRCKSVYRGCCLEAAFIEHLRHSAWQSFRSNWAGGKSLSLQELTHHSMPLGNLHSGNSKPESGHSRPERTNVCSHNAHNYMNVKSTSSCESLECVVNDEALMVQQP